MVLTGEGAQPIPAEMVNHIATQRWHTHVPIYGQFSLANYCNIRVFGLWEEAGVLRENAHRDWENMQTSINNWMDYALKKHQALRSSIGIIM